MPNEDKTEQPVEIYSYKKQKLPARFGLLFVIMAMIHVGLIFMGCKSDEKKTVEKVNLGVSKSFLSIPVYIAKEQGFFLKQGLDLTLKEYSSGKLATRGLFAGEVKVSTVADMPVVFNSFKRNDFCIFATFTSSYFFVKILARKDSGIKTGADLKGKRVGINRGTSSHFYLGVYLIHNNLAISDIEIVHFKTIDLPAALKNGEVDAISVWQPYNQEAERLLQDNTIELPHPEIYRTTFNFAVMKSFAKDHPEILEKIIKATDKATQFIKDNKEKSQEIIVKSFNIDKDSVKSAWNDFSFNISLDQFLLVSWDDIARWAIKNKLVNSKKLPNYLNYICLDSLAKIKPESTTIIR